MSSILSELSTCPITFRYLDNSEKNPLEKSLLVQDRSLRDDLECRIYPKSLTDDLTCCICYELQDDHSCVLSCHYSHVVCRDCLSRVSKSTCPLCKQNLKGPNITSKLLKRIKIISRIAHFKPTITEQSITIISNFIVNGIAEKYPRYELTENDTGVVSNHIGRRMDDVISFLLDHEHIEISPENQVFINISGAEDIFPKIANEIIDQIVYRQMDEMVASLTSIVIEYHNLTMQQLKFPELKSTKYHSVLQRMIKEQLYMAQLNNPSSPYYHNLVKLDDHLKSDLPNDVYESKLSLSDLIPGSKVILPLRHLLFILAHFEIFKTSFDATDKYEKRLLSILVTMHNNDDSFLGWNVEEGVLTPTIIDNYLYDETMAVSEIRRSLEESLNAKTKLTKFIREVIRIMNSEKFQTELRLRKIVYPETDDFVERSMEMLSGWISDLEGSLDFDNPVEIEKLIVVKLDYLQGCFRNIMNTKTNH